jgi:haloacetate dehalogenase
VILDIVPTATIYASLDLARAIKVWRYLFLTQPFDLPERLIGAEPRHYLRSTFDEWSGGPDELDPAALAEYERCFDGATIHATCEDYRAGATIDLADDERDKGSIACPLLVLWSSSGIGASYDVLRIWREQADDVRGRAVDCGHFLAEERPEEIASEIKTFLALVP